METIVFTGHPKTKNFLSSTTVKTKQGRCPACVKDSTASFIVTVALSNIL
jgi:hypothetical protein